MTIEPNYELAVKTLNRIEKFEWVWSVDLCDDIESNNHVFEFGYAEYSAWQLEHSAAWVVEMSPTIADGEVVAYEIIDIEQID